MVELAPFLTNLGLSQYIGTFADNDIDGPALLRPVFEHFTEGHATPDLQAAKALLDDLDQTHDERAGFSGVVIIPISSVKTKLAVVIVPILPIAIGLAGSYNFRERTAEG